MKKKNKIVNLKYKTILNVSRFLKEKKESSKEKLELLKFR